MTTASLWAPGTTDIPSQNADSTFQKQQFTATAAQTLFTLTDFTYVVATNSLLVFDNGVMLIQGVDFTETSSSSFTLAVGATVGHKITAYGLVAVTGTVTTPGAGTVDTASLASGLLVPISKGGTGATTASAALAALGGTAVSGDNAWTGTQSFLDNKFQIKDSSDPTKILEFQLSGIATGTTRTLTVPDASGTILTTAESVPTGTILDYGGTAAPASYLICDGAAVSRTTYAALFAVVSTAFGAGDGSTTFNIPDLRGRVAAGKDDMGGSAANRITNAVSGFVGTTLGAAGGLESHTLIAAEMPSHTHSVGSGASPGTGSDGGNGNPGFSSSQTTGSAGSGSAHRNVQPTIITNKIIKI
jgi:microcystin-dependent protein